jgi:hypothetical protein
LNGFVVRFKDGSGEEVRFETPVPVSEMKQGDSGGVDSDESGGCNIGWSACAFLFCGAFISRVRK